MPCTKWADESVYLGQTSCAAVSCHACLAQESSLPVALWPLRVSNRRSSLASRSTYLESRRPSCARRSLLAVSSSPSKVLAHTI